jgi:hypothetical protein
MEDFVIDSMAWYKDMQLNQDIHLRFFVIASFLQDNEFTKRTIVTHANDIDDGFTIKSSDLTEAGLAFMRGCYAKWVRSIDRGKSPDDTRVLMRCLNNLRG